MAIRQSSGFITEDAPQSITEQSAQQGTGTPESPRGGRIVQGATPKQMDMVGTPAQTQSAQQTRRQVEEGQTLEQKQRYQQKPVTGQYDQAKDKAQTLSQLGPVKSRVQSLIEQRMQSVADTTATLQTNEDKIALLPPEQQQAARDALKLYLQQPSEVENLQAFYDKVGPEALSGGGITNFVQGDEAVLQQLAQQQLGGQVTLGQLDMSQLGVDLGQLEQQLGLQPGAAAAMSLDELDAAIDQVEAQQLNRVEMVRAQLADPNLTPQRRQQLLKELSQLSASGITGLEAQIDQLDQQIQAADTIEIDGQEMSLEKALSDEGISATIAKAVQDPQYLEELSQVPGFENLGEWINKNKAALETLVGALEKGTKDFIEVQNTYENIKTSLGEDSADLLKELFPDVDWDSKSILGQDLQALEQTLYDNNIYQFLSKDPNAQVEAKNNPEYLTDLKLLDQRNFEPEQMGDVMSMMTEEIGPDETLQALLGDMSDLPESPKEYELMRQFIDKYEELDPIVKNNAEVQALVKDGVLDMTDLELIAEQDGYESDIINDLIDNRRATKAWERDVVSAEDPIEYIKNYLFEDPDFTAMDATWAMDNSDSITSRRIAKLFDHDGDGTITEAEMNNSDAIQDNAKDLLNIGMSKEEIIKAQGAIDPDATKMKLAGAITSGQFKKTASNKVKNSITAKRQDVMDNISELSTSRSELAQDMGVTEQSARQLLKKKDKFRQIENLNKKITDAKKVVDSLSRDYGTYNIFGREHKVEDLTKSSDYAVDSRVREAEDERLRKLAEAKKILNSYKTQVGDLTSYLADLGGVTENEIKKIKYDQLVDYKNINKKLSRYQKSEDNLNNIYNSVDDLSEQDLYDLYNEYK